MYVLIPKTKLRAAGNVSFHNTMPDGRAIVHISELKAIGSVTGVDIYTTQRQVKELIAYQNEHGIFPEEPELNPDEGVGDGSVDIPTPDGGTEEPLPDTGMGEEDTPTVLPELDPDLQPQPEPQPEQETDTEGSKVTETDNTASAEKGEQL